MDGTDPHVHTEARVLRGEAAVRNVMASTFGLAGDLPGAVTTGCGVEVPYAMTSARPDKVTCLACREHAGREHLRAVEEIENISRMPGSVVGPSEGRQATERHRALADRFRGTVA